MGETTIRESYAAGIHQRSQEAQVRCYKNINQTDKFKFVCHTQREGTSKQNLQRYLSDARVASTKNHSEAA
jgi:hypothetical protein